MKGVFQILGYALFWLVISVVTFGVGLVIFALLAAATFYGAKEREEKLSDTLGKNLMPSEEVFAEGAQNRPFALWSRRAYLALTSSRVMVIQRGLLGGFKMQDIQWKDLKDARIEQNVMPSLCGSNMEFQHFNGSLGALKVDGIDPDLASRMYGKAQFEEQAWEEKRRVRAMDEKRAAAGGVILHSAPSAGPSSISQPANNMLDDLARAKSLLDDGAISDSEYQEMKSKILAR